MPLLIKCCHFPLSTQTKLNCVSPLYKFRSLSNISRVLLQEKLIWRNEVMGKGSISIQYQMVYASKNKSIEFLLWDRWVCRPSRFGLLIPFLYLFPFSRLCPEMQRMCLFKELGWLQKQNSTGNLYGKSGPLCQSSCRWWSLSRATEDGSWRLCQRMCHCIWLQREELHIDRSLTENHQMQNRLL